MKFIDLHAQQALIRDDLMTRMDAVLAHGAYVMGPEITELEKQLAEFVGVEHCVACSSGTDALLIALLSLGVGAGDQVITTPFSFIATAEVIALLGAEPVFVDIDPRTYNLNPDLLEAAITPRTKAIMPVSLYGQCADFDRINAIAAAHGLPVIEDGAQSFGASYQGRRSCGLTDIACTSFFPAKPLGCYGDGGACFTNDADTAKLLREILNHGQDRRYHHPRLGINGRLDTLQAAVLLAKLKIFPQEVEDRARLGERYSQAFTDRLPEVTTPFLAPGNLSVFAQYTLQADDRDAVCERIQAAGVPVAVHYPVPLNEQPVFAAFADQATPVAAAAAQRVFSLPMHPYLSDAEQDQVIEAVVAAVNS